jgi:hypothetical protein
MMDMGLPDFQTAVTLAGFGCARRLPLILGFTDDAHEMLVAEGST